MTVGEKYHKEQNRSYAGGWGRGDLIAMEVDMDRGTLSYYKNGEALGEAYNNLGKLSGREGGGVVPCVALIARGAKVSIHKHGEWTVEWAVEWTVEWTVKWAAAIQHD